MAQPTVAHGHDQKTGIGQLCEQGFGHFGAGGGDDDAVKGRFGRPALGAVGQTGEDVVATQAVEIATGAV